MNSAFCSASYLALQQYGCKIVRSSPLSTPFFPHLSLGAPIITGQINLACDRIYDKHLELEYHRRSAPPYRLPPTLLCRRKSPYETLNAAKFNLIKSRFCLKSLSIFPLIFRELCLQLFLKHLKIPRNNIFITLLKNK